MAKIQFHQQSGEIKDVLVTNQDRPFLYIKSGYMFEVVLKLLHGGRNKRYPECRCGFYPKKDNKPIQLALQL